MCVWDIFCYGQRSDLTLVLPTFGLGRLPAPSTPPASPLHEWSCALGTSHRCRCNASPQRPQTSNLPEKICHIWRVWESLINTCGFWHWFRVCWIGCWKITTVQTYKHIRVCLDFWNILNNQKKSLDHWISLGFLRWKLSSSIPASRDLLVALMSSLETCKVPKLFQVVQLGGLPSGHLT